MIPQKIKEVFQFIEFLHSNIETFKGYESDYNNLMDLDKKRNKLNPNNNYKDRIQYQKINKQFGKVLKHYSKNTTSKIRDKAKELKICDFTKEPYYINSIGIEIAQLKSNFTKTDIIEIQKHKKKYIAFREKTNSEFFLSFFFMDLDREIKVLFDFFKDSDKNEFENFELKPIQVKGSTKIKKQKKAGRKPAELLPVKDYLLFYNNLDKDTFLKELKSSYNGCKPKVLIHLVMVLREKNVLKPATNKEYKEVFEKELNAINQSQSNFNNQLNCAPDKILFESIKKTIESLIFNNSLVLIDSNN